MFGRFFGRIFDKKYQYRYQFGSCRNNAMRTNQHLEDAERSPLASDEVPCWLQSGDINIQSPWVWEPGYLYSRISIATSRRTLRSSADTRKTFCDSIKDQDRRMSFSTLGTAGLEQSTTGHSQCFIRTIVQVEIKNSLLQTGLQLTKLDLHCASRWHCTWCLLRSIIGRNNNNNFLLLLLMPKKNRHQKRWQ